MKNRRMKQVSIPQGLVYILGVIAIGLAVILGIQYEKQQKLQQSIAEKIIRFHVLANSDSEKDQALKLQVRDAVGAQMGELLKNVDNKDASEDIIKGNLEEIEQLARNIILAEGYSYEVKASLAQVDFPVKTYGDYTFPAGEYEALEVVIGEGAGHNWWCVMYPNMCFSGSVYEIVDETAKEELREILTEEEYQQIFSKGEYEIRFKYLPFLQKD